MIQLTGRVQETGRDVLGLQVRVVRQNLIPRLPRGEELEDVEDTDTHPSDARTAPALLRVNCDPAQKIRLAHVSPRCIGSYKPTRDEAHQRVRHESDLDSDPAMSGNVLWASELAVPNLSRATRSRSPATLPTGPIEASCDEGRYSGPSRRPICYPPGDRGHRTLRSPSVRSKAGPTSEPSATETISSERSLAQPLHDLDRRSPRISLSFGAGVRGNALGMGGRDLFNFFSKSAPSWLGARHLRCETWRVTSFELPARPHQGRASPK